MPASPFLVTPLILPSLHQRVSGNCVLGATVVLERRRADHCCRNGLGYIREISFTRCTCSEDDFEWYEHSHGAGVRRPIMAPVLLVSVVCGVYSR